MAEAETARAFAETVHTSAAEPPRACRRCGAAAQFTVFLMGMRRSSVGILCSPCERWVATLVRQVVRVPKRRGHA